MRLLIYFWLCSYILIILDDATKLQEQRCPSSTYIHCSTLSKSFPVCKPHCLHVQRGDDEAPHVIRCASVQWTDSGTVPGS